MDELRGSQEALVHQAYHDPLTGLASMAHLRGRLTEVRGGAPRRHRPEVGLPADRREHHMAHGKKYLEAAKLVDRDRTYGPVEAAALAKETVYMPSHMAALVLGRGPRPAPRPPARQRPCRVSHGSRARRPADSSPSTTSTLAATWIMPRWSNTTVARAFAPMSTTW